ncbi:hypothetical protein [Vibrio sp. SCSIO 43136]|uniref:hypothetical protein n=1 Tax=Vibrio sp. SCSIO 43136 TaxID=2819101 RepID=UPI0020764691|nr:hypothetical protein [Vibrio sp. SCSIO 43136]USD64737.1 hypothetical protein J4N39_11695 [Vibrio sp. SCSIO 43136]
MRCLVIIGSVLALASCAETIVEREPVEVQIVPIYYTLEVNLKKSGEKGARRYLNEFVEKHWDIISSQPVEIGWTTTKGKKVAMSYEDYLVSLGIAQGQLSVVEVPKSADAKVFDVRLRAIKHKSVTSVCEYYRSGHWGRNIDGCYSESARWLSMSNPEKALLRRD